jgi:hypothetical protein
MYPDFGDKPDPLESPVGVVLCQEASLGKQELTALFCGCGKDGKGPSNRNLPDQDVLRVWRINGVGDVVQRRDIAVPDADTDGPSRLVVTAAGVYASVSTESDHLDATILRLDHSSLATMASVDVDVLEDLAASPDAVWAVTLQCNTFLWHRFTSDLASTGHPWALPDQSYTVAPAGDRVWSLRTREPMEAELVAGYPG